jgi:adenylate kinase family enzyme
VTVGVRAPMSLRRALAQRTVVIGNSGSGKSVFAESLATLVLAPVVDLDLLHWEDVGLGAKRNEETARQMVSDATDAPSWIIEGVYGWLAEGALPRATALVWLDLPWSICRRGLLARGPRRGASEASFAALLKWAEDYWERRTSSSFDGHLNLFNGFCGEKIRLSDRDQIRELLSRLSSHRMRPSRRWSTGNPRF